MKSLNRCVSVDICVTEDGQCCVELYDYESGDCTSREFTYDMAKKHELDEWLGSEVFSWIEWMLEDF